MSDSPEPGSNLKTFTVGELANAIKGTLEGSFGLVRLKGEISGFKRHSSGHLYFSLKDDAALIDAVIWRGPAMRLATQPEDGLEVIATGRLTTYAPRSRYQIVVDSIELAGQGALLKLLEERKKKLTAEGLFAPERKKRLPFLPEVIGVVTSPTGAVIRDILHRLRDRFPRPVLVWPVAVQGDGAANQIAAAIRGFNALAPDGPVRRPDVLIIARGGGSLEDLWAFNEEIVVRAAAASIIPLIAAVGHETDWTLIDFAADVRAPTPTAAAEMAVPVRMDLLGQVLDRGGRMAGAINRQLAENRTRLEGLARGLPNLRRLVEEAAQRLDDWSERLAMGLRVGLDRRRARLAELVATLPKPKREIAEAERRLRRAARSMAVSIESVRKHAQSELKRWAELLASYSYERVLERGFALVRDNAGQPIASVAATRPGLDVTIRFADGDTQATVRGAPKSDAKAKAPRGKVPEQGDLL